jgi:hypothetical protein
LVSFPLAVNIRTKIETCINNTARAKVEKNIQRQHFPPMLLLLLLRQPRKKRAYDFEFKELPLFDNKSGTE